MGRVERVTHWLNEQGNSSPFKFGLVELKFYTHGSQRLVIPRTVLKTREISRHVVVVDIRPNFPVTTSAQVTDEYQGTSGGRVQESRAVKSAALPMNKGLLLQQVSPGDLPVVSQLIEQMESLGFDQRGSASYLQFGFTYPTDDGEFYPLAYLGSGGIWTQMLKPLRDLIGEEAVLEFHREANRFGTFYKPEQIDKPESFSPSTASSAWTTATRSSRTRQRSILITTNSGKACQQRTPDDSPIWRKKF